MAQNEQKQQFRCTGDCLNCPRVQREYCASQKSLENQRILVSMQEAIKIMSGTIEELKVKISAIQDNEAMAFAPDVEIDPIAQEGAGAEE